MYSFYNLINHSKLCNTSQHSHRWQWLACKVQEKNHSSALKDQWSNLGFSVLPKDTGGRPLYHLSHSRQEQGILIHPLYTYHGSSASRPSSGSLLTPQTCITPQTWVTLRQHSKAFTHLPYNLNLM